MHYILKGHFDDRTCASLKTQFKSLSEARTQASHDVNQDSYELTRIDILKFTDDGIELVESVLPSE